MTFILEPRLSADTIPAGNLALSELRLMNNALFPWFILVPKRDGLVEITDLPKEERITLMEEICAVSDALCAALKPDKINIAALGNQVRQLHVHVIARFTTDAAWPQPVWGKAAAPYAEKEAEKVIEAVRRLL